MDHRGQPENQKFDQRYLILADVVYHLIVGQALNLFLPLRTDSLKT